MEISEFNDCLKRCTKKDLLLVRSHVSLYKIKQDMADFNKRVNENYKYIKTTENESLTRNLIILN